MSNTARRIILDELIENSHPEKVEDVIYWALVDYVKNNDTIGSVVAYSIIESINDAELNGNESLLNPITVNEIFKNQTP